MRGPLRPVPKKHKQNNVEGKPEVDPSTYGPKRGLMGS